MSKFFLKIFVILLINLSAALAQDVPTSDGNGESPAAVNKNDFEERRKQRKAELKEKIEARNREIKERNAQKERVREQRKFERRGGSVGGASVSTSIQSRQDKIDDRREEVDEDRRDNRREERRDDRREERREERRDDRRENPSGNSSQPMFNQNRQIPNDSQAGIPPVAAPAAQAAPAARENVGGPRR